MTNRQVAQRVQGVGTQDGAGVSLTRIIGQPLLRHLDPFLMLDFFGSDQPNEYLAGFPAHPHRGFQTVTYMLKGKMRHKDSVGNEGVIETGGIQWMNAGRGIIHEEMPEQTDGLLKGFQLWVNLPAKDKMSAPGYQDIPAEQVPSVALNPHASAKVLAGELMNVNGPVKTAKVSPMFIDVHWQSCTTVDIPIQQGHNAFIYCYEGRVDVDGTDINAGTLAVLSDGNQVTLNCGSDAKVAGKAILVAAQPIGEPIVQYGPFVMNSESEIQQALFDYQRGTLA